MQVERNTVNQAHSSASIPSPHPAVHRRTLCPLPGHIKKPELLSKLELIAESLYCMYVCAAVCGTH